MTGSSLKTKATHVMAALSWWALPPTQRAELNRDEYTRPAFAERAEAYVRLVNAGIMSVEEVRIAERLSGPAPAVSITGGDNAPIEEGVTVSEILLRNDGTLTDVDRKLRLIELIAVPWDQPTEVFWRGDIWTEVFERGAFDGIESRTDSIRVNREHVKGNTVGKIIDFDPAHLDGLFARVKIVKGPKGDEVLDLAEDDMISPSVGYRAQKPTDVRLDKQTRQPRSSQRLPRPSGHGRRSGV